jgi:NADH-quinone oxidoreductase subunit A
MHILLSPPIAFLIVIFSLTALSYLFSKLAFRNGKTSERLSDAYACGEENIDNMIQPDYSQFFPFAFFFTILHVVALMIATVQVDSGRALAIAFVYIAVAIVGLMILLRRA